jgi:DNA polymerase IIIc chi subunit
MEVRIINKDTHFLGDLSSGQGFLTASSKDNMDAGETPTIFMKTGELRQNNDDFAIAINGALAGAIYQFHFKTTVFPVEITRIEVEIS